MRTLCVLLLVPLIAFASDGHGATVTFDPATRAATIQFSVRDFDSGVAEIRADGLAVFENGVRQQPVTLNAERRPVSVGILVERGGRPDRLNKTLMTEAAFLTRPIITSLQPEDRLALFTYADSLEPLIDFATPPRQRDGVALSAVGSSPESNVRLYDAAIDALRRLAAQPGARALIIVTSGVDATSQATLDDVVAMANANDTPIVTIGLGRLAREYPNDATAGPLAKAPWPELERRLDVLASRTGGRAFLRHSSVDVANRVRELASRLGTQYTVTYASATRDPIAPRHVQVRSLDPSGRPAATRGATARSAPANVLAEATYSPVAAPLRSSNQWPVLTR